MKVSWPNSIVLVACLLSVFSPSASRAQSASSAERQLFDAVNRERRSRRLTALRWDESLADAARNHALEMAKRNSVSHQFLGEPNLPSRARQAGARYTWLAENVDQAPNAATIHQRFMFSPLHRANILGTDMDSVGIGMAERNGQLFVVEDFCQAK